LLWLVFLRVVTAFLALAAVYVLYPPRAVVGAYLLIGMNVLFNLVGAALIDRRASSQGFILAQVYWDFVYVTALIFLTGGYYSLFSFLYILTIIFAATLTGRGHTYAVAAFSSLGYGAVLFGQFYELLPAIGLGELETHPVERSEVAVRLSLNAVAYLGTGLMANYLAARSRVASLQVVRQRREMEELRRLHENIVQSVPIGLITCDRHDNIIFANDAVAPLLGVGRAVLRGQRLGELLPALAGAPRRLGTFDIERAKDDGAKQTVWVTLADLRDTAGRAIGRVVSLRDVTTLRELEQAAKQADRQAAVGKLAAGIAHEIRNPLASMSGSIQLLQSELKLNPDQRRLMNIVVREMDRLNDLINDFLIYARPTPRRDTRLDLAAVLEEQLGILAHDPACQDRVTIDKEIRPNLIGLYDSDQLRQLFWNLFVNALQAMDEGPGTLTVRAGYSDRYPGYFEVEVRDTGKGIEADALASVFDPFFTTKEKGTGMGLTIAYKIVEAHSGKIFVDSTPGGGASFHVLLPYFAIVARPEERPPT
jgi:two-component system sensor histidine kinase PilS (NtrC family)